MSVSQVHAASGLALSVVRLCTLALGSSACCMVVDRPKIRSKDRR